MIRYQRRYWALAACLSAIAGFVDATAFIKLGGFFVSFMSGNSTRLGVGLASAPGEAALAAGLIGVFVVGVILGALICRGAADKDGPRVRVLVLVAGLLAAAALSASFGFDSVAIVLMALAMGAENAVFQRDGEVSIGLTYMTGTLVKLGQRLAATLTGGPRFGWAPYLLLWSGLIVGGLAGALSYAQFALLGLWIAAAATAVLALVSYKLGAGVKA
jgi:uncharacterized membrane protein YoaK (UPF0700 family)